MPGGLDEQQLRLVQLVRLEAPARDFEHQCLIRGILERRFAILLKRELRLVVEVMNHAGAVMGVGLDKILLRRAPGCRPAVRGRRGAGAGQPATSKQHTAQGQQRGPEN